jgi:dipeptidase E
MFAGVPGLLHLIGGGPGAMAQTARHIRAAVAAVQKPRPLVAYVGAASGDNAAFRQLIGAVFIGTGARVEAVKLTSPRAKVSVARQVLEGADLVFISGGDVDQGMRVLHDRGVVELLRALGDGGRPMMGLSAGSIMLGRAWVRFVDDRDDQAELFDCLGVAPVHLDTHSEDDGWSELRTLVRLLGDEAVGYGVPSAGCLVVDREDGRPSLRARGAAVVRLAGRGGAVVEDGAIAP